jgi:release factor glutamine methyltransferase
MSTVVDRYVGIVGSIADVLAGAEARLRGAGVEGARIEAEVLICHALSVTRERLFARLRHAMPADAQQTFTALLARRLAHEPSAYITRHREFYGLEFECTPAALIPRPETELLVELALAWIKDTDVPYPTMVDVGTGTGAIAIATAVNAPNTRVIATDTSRAALTLARGNAETHGVAKHIDFVESDLLSAIRGPFDIIAANLPYIPTRLYQELPPEISGHEPQIALHSGPRGTEVIERLLASASGGLRPRGLLLAEHAWDQGAALRATARRVFPDALIDTKRDLSGNERVLVVRTN